MLPILAIPALLPLLVHGVPATSDGGLHLLRIASLDRALRAGVFLPRWQPEFLLGYGYPTFNYYAPASYYAAEALHLLGLNLLQAFAGTFALALLAAGFGMYALALEIYGARAGNARVAALVAATAYMLGPYLLLNIYNRGALAEVCALALLPWLFWSARRLMTAERPALAAFILALLTAGLAVTHTISLLFAPLLLVAWLLVLGRLHGTLRARLPWMVAAMLLAMGASAFYWLPLLFERSYLSAQAFEISRQGWLPGNVWTWRNFLQRSPIYALSAARPVQLGLVQLILAVAGLLAGLRAGRGRDGEWLFWLVVALATGALIGAWSLPLWQNTVLSIAQFPWRLLGALSLPLALFTGGLLLGVESARLRWGLAAAAIGLLLVAQTPRVAGVPTWAPASVQTDASVVAAKEQGKGAAEGGEGVSSVQEFRPRWAAAELVLANQPEDGGATPIVRTRSANAWDLELEIEAAEETPLRFTTFYFPGWRALLDGATVLEPRPETNLGLLTVTVPAGSHTLAIEWTGTALERAANWVSLLTWAGMALWLLLRPNLRRLFWAPLLLTALGVTALLWTRSSAPVQQPLAAADLGGVRLLGAQVEERPGDPVILRPFWQVVAPIPADTFVRWQLQSLDGAVLADVAARPWFNMSNTREWVVNSVVDDGSLLPLPAGLPAGSYRLGVALTDSLAADGVALPPLLTIELDADAPADPVPASALAARVGESTQLLGYSLQVNGRAVEPAAQPAVVRPGDRVDYMLYWRPEAALVENIHAFAHLVDAAGAPLAQVDQEPGPLAQSPEAWLPGRTYTDRMRLQIPADATSGLYTPRVGLYRFEGLERLPVSQPDREAPSDFVALPALKVLARPARAKLEPIDISLGDFARLTGYSIEPDGPLQPGAMLTVTLQYRSQAATPLDLTRFLQLHGGALGMAAQSDGPPQAGANPTWAWQPGETIVETVPLTLAADAPPGAYTLYFGLYDLATGARTPLTASGAPVPDDALPLATLLIGESE